MLPPSFLVLLVSFKQKSCLGRRPHHMNSATSAVPRWQIVRGGKGSLSDCPRCREDSGNRTGPTFLCGGGNTSMFHSPTARANQSAVAAMRTLWKILHFDCARQRTEVMPKPCHCTRRPLSYV
ncbi:hypothetical protein ElyMa_000534800 [Elysia marginata]|uniref:Secreted protein n=1 Tax=Elysia marginata TaxID=1093978 RepID=A0AAV4FYR6_9GAST|nr:hypothetical protein ElyMa_000534800 [Elysia marginata]